MYQIRLSPYHKIFYNEWKLDPSSSKYNIVFDQTISSDLDVIRLKIALNRFIVEQLLFNSHVLEINGEPCWVRNSDINQLEFFNDGYTYSQIFKYVSRPFNLNSEPLYRFAVFKEVSGNYRFVVVLHHMIIDGASVDMLISEISKYYNNEKYCVPYPIDEQIRRLYITTNELINYLKNNEMAGRTFWNDELNDVEPIDFSFLKRSSNSSMRDINKNKVKEICFSFDKSIFLQLKQLTKEYKISTYFYGQMILGLLIYKYTNQNKFAIACPLAVKKHLHLMYGVGINTIVIPYHLSNDSTILQLIKNIKLITATLKNEVNSSIIVSELIAEKNLNLFTAFFSQTNLKNTPFHFAGTEVFDIKHEFNIDLTCKVLFEQEVKNYKVDYRIRYNILETDELLIKNFVEGYKKLFLEILQDMVNNSCNKRVSEYSILQDGYKVHLNKLIQQISDTLTVPELIHMVFEKQVVKTPDHIAVTYNSVNFTYKNINMQSNQLANYLNKSLDVAPGDYIVICLERSEQLIISILAVLKLGCAYIPINSLAIDRTEYIINDVKPKIIVTDNINYNCLKCLDSYNVVIIDNLNTRQDILKQEDSNVVIDLKPDSLAYIIYTSGTTGKPKGVLQQHASVTQLFTHTQKLFNFNHNDVWTLFHSYTFDFSIWEIWGALFYGGRLVIPTQEEVNDFYQFYELCRQNSVTVLNQTPSAFYVFSSIATQVNNLEKLSFLRYVMFGGESLNLSQLKSWIKYYGDQNPQLVNMYGITETAVHVTYKFIKKADVTAGSLIGIPISDQITYVLDNNLQLLPIGAIGELYIGGARLAKGYLNQPNLTKQKFIQSPFVTNNIKKEYSRLYKTGDLARVLPDGELEYMGRNDSQVKIRGYRIELGEIENLIAQYSSIKQIAVLPCQGKNVNNLVDNTYLVAYYVSESELDEAAMLEYIRHNLPIYMVPQLFLRVNNIPLTTNGKLDKLSLPKPEFSVGEDYVAPRNDLELTICNMYADVLQMSPRQVGINHDFFRIGGNSVLAVRLTTKLQYNFEIKVDDIFKLRTPGKIAETTKFVKDNLRYKLEQVQLIYEKLENIQNKDLINAQIKRKNYLLGIRKPHAKYQDKNINALLLTGATGHLGCNILYQLLISTKYKINLLVRGKSARSAYLRLKNKFRYYFDNDLDNYKNRLIIFASDIEKQRLGLKDIQYNFLANSIDSIIHAAALVKHYGDYDSFYSANVQSTINLLELAKLNKIKEFHYISTLSVFTDGYIPDCSYYIFDEEDNNSILEGKNNIYVKTKYEGELVVAKYREYGLNTNIYRVGNLSMNSQSCKSQENIDENAFFSRIKTILNLGIMPQELSKIEISPVDCTALAIVKLFNKVGLENKTYHLANIHSSNLFNLFNQCNNINVINTKMRDFIDTILSHLNKNEYSKEIELFMLHQGWLQGADPDHVTKIEILQERTNNILSELDFTWPQVTSNMLSDIIRKSFERINIMIEKEQIFKHLKYMAAKMPCNLYWLDLDHKILGANQRTLDSIGALNLEDIVGKTVYNVYPKNIADDLTKHFNQVIKKQVDVTQEHTIKDITTGKLRTYVDTVSPILDNSDKPIGIIGTSIETTAEKESDQLKHENRKLEAQNKLNKIILEKEAAEAEHLRLENEVHKLENEKHKVAAEEQEKFKKFVGQIVHDIQSPLSSLRGLVNESSQVIPEEERITLRQASMRISDIAQHMLSRYKNEIDENEIAEPVLVSAAMLAVLGEKRYEHKEVNFVTNFKPQADFVFIQIGPNQFKRMISNLLNNAVEALENKSDGKIDLRLNTNSEWVIITITDNGKGMSVELIDKIKKGVAITEGKKHGSGIGLTQVCETVQHNFGELEILSSECVRTSILLKFPKVPAPFWIAEEIKIVKDDVIVVLDDDPSIHGAWDSMLAPSLAKIPELKVKHFSEGEEAVSFINSLSDEEKSYVCLLTDYELLHQGINGLQVIKQTKIKRSTLVTSHYANKEIREHATNLRIKILPKELAFAVKINLNKKIKPGSKKVDMVWVDDARWFIRDWKKHFTGLTIDSYYEPDSFLEDVHQYPLDTKIILDRNYYDREGEGRKFLGDGLTIAKTLHEKGYTNLFMITGEEPEPNIIPDYLTVMLKSEDEKIKEIAKL